MECGRHVGLHLDQEVSLLGDLYVAVLDLVLDPGAERLPEEGEGKIEEPLPWYLVHVAILGQVVVDDGVLPGLFEDALDAEVNVLGGA